MLRSYACGSSIVGTGNSFCKCPEAGMCEEPREDKCGGAKQVWETAVSDDLEGKAGPGHTGHSDHIRDCELDSMCNRS